MIELLNIYQVCHLLQVYFYGNNKTTMEAELIIALGHLQKGNLEPFYKGCENQIKFAHNEAQQIEAMSPEEFAKQRAGGDEELYKDIKRNWKEEKQAYIYLTCYRKIQIAQNMKNLLDILPKVVTFENTKTIG